jgi:hypothetical protein
MFFTIHFLAKISKATLRNSLASINADFQECLKRCVGHREGRREERDPTSGLRLVNKSCLLWVFFFFMDPKTNQDEWASRTKCIYGPAEVPGLQS